MKARDSVRAFVGFNGAESDSFAGSFEDDIPSASHRNAFGRLRICCTTLRAPL